jgi:hypothetical protein
VVAQKPTGKSKENKDVKQTDTRCKMREKIERVHHLLKASECSKDWGEENLKIRELRVQKGKQLI